MSSMLDWLACGFVSLVGWLLCRLPPEAAVRLGERLGGAGYWLQRKRTRIGLANVQAAFDGRLTRGQARRIIRAYYRQLGAGVVELLRLPVIDRAYVERYVAIDGQRRFEEAVASGRPVILLTGHYGNWELSSIVAALRGYPITALARVQDRLPRLYRLLVSYRESKGCVIVHKGGALKRLLMALDQRRCVGIVGDQASRQGVLVEFFGRQALFAAGPFELAYRKDAILLPIFIRRVSGPRHRITIEPPITLSRNVPRDEAIRQGIERFAGLLARHIRQDPTQWLWLHKRWKHTPSRRVLVLSDGKLGHVKQSLAVVEMLRARCKALSAQTIEIRYRGWWARALALAWSGCAPAWAPAWCLRLALDRRSGAALLRRYADVIVSCGASTAPVNVLWSAEQRAKSVAVMNPAPLPLGRFTLVVVPRHDRVPARANVVSIDGALTTGLEDEALRRARDRLQRHPKFQRIDAAGRHPVIAVFLGGSTAAYDMPVAWAESLIAQVQAACEALDGWCMVTTSRRTAPLVERALAARLAKDRRCRLLLLAGQDPLDGTMEGMLGWADAAVVTGESISMVSEACASGRPVAVVELPARRAAPTKHARFLRGLLDEEAIQLVPVSALSAALQDALSGHAVRRPRAAPQAAVVEAVSRLL